MDLITQILVEHPISAFACAAIIAYGVAEYFEK